MRPSILLTNDDGVRLNRALGGVRSPRSHRGRDGRRPGHPAERSRQVDLDLRAAAGKPGRAERGACVGSGRKPTDAVIIGLYALKLNPTMVVSGINIGENLSFESIMTSGTIGAALEASNQGVKGIAFSLQVEDQGDKFDDPRTHGQSFEAAKKIVRDVTERVLAHGFPPDADVINVNIPSQVKGGYEVTRLARKLFHTGVEKRLDPRGRPYFWINGPLFTDAGEGTDVHSVRMGNISITPITLDCTAHKAHEGTRKIFLS